VKIKHNANAEVLRGKSVIIIDDSIVRGTTSRKLIAMLRSAGARELHMRVSAPPTIDPCFYGIDTPKKDELIAARLNLEEIRKFLAVDSLAYLSLEGMYRAVHAAPVRAAREPGSEKARTLQLVKESSSDSSLGQQGTRSAGSFCDACFSGNYPVGTPAQFEKRQTTFSID
jgi:glutamine phosphoribosylpyrophosphate amidotransferase